MVIGDKSYLSPITYHSLMVMQRRERDGFEHGPRTRLNHRSAAEREVSLRRATRRDGHVHLLLGAVGAAFMPRDHGVLARRYALQRVAAVFLSNGKERMLRNRNVGLHPWMLVALDRHEHLGATQLVHQRRSAVGLSLVPVRIVLGRKVNVVLGGIAV